jgi:hypothetical protein
MNETTLRQAVEAVPAENLRNELTDAWHENSRLRRLLSAMIETDGTRVGLVEVYACDPDTRRVAGMGLVVCTPGDETALAEACAKVLIERLNEHGAEFEAVGAEVTGVMAAKP